MSDLHLEFEAAYWKRIHAAARRGDSSTAADALRVRAELRAEPGHPDQGPDLRRLKAEGIDLLLLPGDLHVGIEAIAYAKAAAVYLECGACVCGGNHEAYHGDLAERVSELREAAAWSDGKVKFLEREAALDIRARRVIVLGATLWTDYRANGDERTAMIAADRALNDHRLIRCGDTRFTPAQARAIHLATREWFGQAVIRARDEADKVVIMTHHAPIPDANPPQFRGGELAPAFVSDLRQEILEWQPDLWVWGHTHHSMRDRLGRTELASAQRGYLGSEPGAESFAPAVIAI